MRLRRFKLTIFLLFGLGLTSLKAQESVNASGGNASGSGGSVSYSAGQVFYTTHSNAFGKVSQGVQQPFEILVPTGFEDVKGINLSCTVYPNPTNDFVILKVDASANFNIKSMSYQLYEINGKLLDNKKLAGKETIIDLSKLVPATYLIKIIEDHKEIKAFKIIKNQGI
jgi:hypothetical protein